MVLAVVFVVAIGVAVYIFSSQITGFITADQTGRPVVKNKTAEIQSPVQNNDTDLPVPAPPAGPADQTGEINQTNQTTQTGGGGFSGGGSFGSGGGGTGNTGSGSGSGSGTGTGGGTQNSRIYLNPSQSSASVGSEFSVDVMIDAPGENVYSAQFDINFASEILEMSDKIVDGDFLKQGDTVIYSFTENIKDGSMLVGITRAVTQTGATGSGRLATLTFTAKSAGTSQLNVSQVKLISPNLNQIACISSNGTVGVS